MRTLIFPRDIKLESHARLKKKMRRNESIIFARDSLVIARGTVFKTDATPLRTQLFLPFFSLILTERTAPYTFMKTNPFTQTRTMQSHI